MVEGFVTGAEKCCGIIRSRVETGSGGIASFKIV
jgi:hypothetical protein